MQRSRASGRPGRWYGRPLALDVRILGPLEVRDGDTVLRLGGPKQRALLVLLVLRANEIVSADRLVEELWDGSPPDDAATALQAHISRLRKALPDGTALLTRSPGYVLELGPHQLDRSRFDRLVDDGRAAVEAGDAASGAGLLGEALALWRGRPLADLENEPFARDVVARLDESWLAAIEARIDADLALQRHEELVAELTALVRAHPLREHLRAQLMLALYRSGRQAEALAAYADGRRVLVDELGLEPGPELQRLQQAILAHDPELVLDRARTASRRSRRLAPVAVMAGGVIAIVGAAIGLLGGDGSRREARVARDTGIVTGIDVRTGDEVGTFRAGRTPAALVARDGVVWMVDADARTLVRLDTQDGTVETLATGATPTDVAVGDGSVWVADGRRLTSSQFVGPVAIAVAGLDATTRTERVRVDLPEPRGAVSNLVDDHLAVSATAVWAVTADFAVARIDIRTGAITATSRAVSAAAVAAGGAGVWVLGVDGSVVRLDERSAGVIARRRVDVASAGSIAVGEDAVWVTSPVEGTLWRLDPRGRSPGRTAIDPGITDVVAGASGVAVVNPSRSTVALIDAANATVRRVVSVDGVPRAAALDGDTLWVASAAGPEPGRAGAIGGVTTLPGSICETAIAGTSGKADVLVVSDLPLQGGIRIGAAQMSQAIAFVLRERGFRAGRFRVAYQSCDDSIARTGLFDPTKCASNAKAYGKNGDVVGVIGTLNSGCAVAALPVLNRAAGGPVPMVSPFNSFVGLTRAAPGVDPALPASLYPTGRRNYVRVFPTDDLQGAALALHARDAGFDRVFVLDDGDPGYGGLMATGFETAARRLGLEVVGRRSWDPRAGAYDSVAAAVARARAAAVFVGGLLDTNAAAVVRALRARLGEGVAILGPDGLTPLPLFVERAGDAATGVIVSVPGLLTEGLPAAGVRFVERFGRTQPGAVVEPSAVYAAQAAEVLLDAIAGSDGTRESVLEQLFRTRVQDGLLGTFRFDANGDASEAPITILRVARRGESRTIQSAEGGEVIDVARPAQALVAQKPAPERR